MAERRMFSRKIINSDRFTELPFSAQTLYFHLGMEADDDGLLNNANRIRRVICAGEADVQLLEKNGYKCCGTIYLTDGQSRCAYEKAV